jgi:hypothetical protein
MKLTPWFLAALAPIAVAGCSGALMGHVAVLAVAIGIFVGTLSLGRQTGSESDPKTVVTQLKTPAVGVPAPNKAA